MASNARMRSSASTPSLRSSTPVQFRGYRESLQGQTYVQKSGDNSGGNVKVVVRVRTLLPRELDKEAPCLVEMNPNTQSTILYAPTVTDQNMKRKLEKKLFTFDNSFWSVNPEDDHYADQDDVYNCLGEEFLDHNFEGYHTCIFAYGQTGSGKSYTMMGTSEKPGLIPRTCEDLFQRIESNDCPNISYTVRVSYFEVYNEHVRDLLVPKKDTPYYLKVRESPTEGPYIKDLTEVPVKNLQEVLKYMRQGDTSRSVASTKMNDVSSRSHAVFTLVLKQIYHDMERDETTERLARIRLVDLAGSERAKSTEATGQRLREGSNINKSLTTLGRVIAALAESGNNPRRKDVVPYRDSVLTWLLKDSLGGNSKTAMIACISPTDYDETLSTLRYADQAKNIKLRAIVNQDQRSSAARDAQIEEMSETIRTLQLSLSQATATKKQTETQNVQLEEYQKQVDRMQQLMEENRQIAECKIRSLQTQNDALKLHLKLALESLKNPIPPVPDPEEKENSMIYEEEDEQEEVDEELSLHLEDLMKDLGNFRKKLADDSGRFSGKIRYLQELPVNC
ncbi:Kinesin-1 [Drechslerella dactyloides]|uniref:Kinesin-like protein n=1 Tax=Drechslerella dactyloides TaxID=74499 RepID=A0AAD6NM73_DREDA|nr:Kinesin-1 [Drechslerella dactyloides]